MGDSVGVSLSPAPDPGTQCVMALSLQSRPHNVVPICNQLAARLPLRLAARLMYCVQMGWGLGGELSRHLPSLLAQPTATSVDLCFGGHNIK